MTVEIWQTWVLFSLFNHAFPCMGSNEECPWWVGMRKWCLLVVTVHDGYAKVMSFCGECMQNDLVHGWGLDFSLQRCVQVRNHPYTCVLLFVEETFWLNTCKNGWQVHCPLMIMSVSWEAVAFPGLKKGLGFRAFDNWCLYDDVIDVITASAWEDRGGGCTMAAT